MLFCYVLILAIGIHFRPLVLKLKKLRAWILENAKFILLVARVTCNPRFLLTKYWFFLKEMDAHIFKLRQNKTKEFTNVLRLLSNSAPKSNWKKWPFCQSNLKWILKKNHRDPLRRHAVEAVFNFDIFMFYQKSINIYFFISSGIKFANWTYEYNWGSCQNIIWR